MDSNHVHLIYSTNSLYTHAEKEAMLRYVVERKMYGRVKGKLLYKEMEAANVSILWINF